MLKMWYPEQSSVHGERIHILSKKYDGQDDKLDQYRYLGSAVYYVGRGKDSILGNPYNHRQDLPQLIKTATVKEAVEKYEVWLRTQYVNNPAVREAIHKITNDYRQGKDVYLICWCAPAGGINVYKKPWICHAQVIANAVIKITEKMENRNGQGSQEGKE